MDKMKHVTMETRSKQDNYQNVTALSVEGETKHDRWCRNQKSSKYNKIM